MTDKNKYIPDLRLGVRLKTIILLRFIAVIGQLLTIIVVGNILLYTLGIFWLGNFIGWDKPVLELGLYPFFIGDLIKIFLVVILLPSVWKYVNRIKS